MAVVIAFRVAIALQPTLTRWVIVSSPVGAPKALIEGRALWDRLHDPGESDGDLEAAVEAASGSVASVTTFNSPFELRKLQVLYGRASGDPAGDDDAVTTHHFLRVSGGNPSADWVAADFELVEAQWDAWWNVVKGAHAPATVLKQYRWYKTGPQIDEALGGPGRTGPPVRVVDRTLAGTATAGPHLPPQVAVSVTEKTSDKTAWGRFYLPAPLANSSVLGSTGRLGTTPATAWINAIDTSYEACKAGSILPVVYSSAKPERPISGGGTLPARGARALTVDDLQLDDLFDVIRSRRWSQPLLRLQRAVA